MNYTNETLVKVKKRNHNVRIFAKAKDFLLMFFEKSGIHGFTYLARPTLHFIEKLFWLFLICISIFACGKIGMQSLDRYNDASTVVSLEKDHYYWNTTIPSLTICPLQRLKREKFDEYAKSINVEGQDKEELLEFLESLANSSYINFENIKAYQSLDKLNINPQDYLMLIYNLTEDYRLRNDDNLRVTAMNDAGAIHTQQILTEYGICYMANNFLSESMSTQNLILGQPTYEVPFEKNYSQYGEVYMVRSGNYFDGDITYSFLGFDSDITVFLHSPNEIMQIERSFGFSSEALEFDVQSLEIIVSDNFEKATNVRQRKCRFPHETNLTHFPIYTKNICHQECRIDAAYILCKCIPHFYPNKENKKRVCSYKELMECFPKYKDEFLQLQFYKIPKLENFKCYCLQNCRESKVILNNLQIMGESKDLLRSIGGIAIVKKYPVIRYKRQVLFTFSDLLVSIGGTAGFFLGFSVLSAVEIIYFFTLRLFWYARGYK